MSSWFRTTPKYSPDRIMFEEIPNELALTEAALEETKLYERACFKHLALHTLIPNHSDMGIVDACQFRKMPDDKGEMEVEDLYRQVLLMQSWKAQREYLERRLEELKNGNVPKTDDRQQISR